MVSKSMVKRACVGIAVVGLMSGWAGSREAQAHRRDFPFTYDWRQPAKGEKEIELHSRYLGSDNSFQQQIEFEYGITDRWSIAPYVVFEKEPGPKMRYHEWKVETRYQLGTYKTGRILPGLYLEYAKPKEEKGEVEGKLIFSRYDKKGGNLSLNLVAERSLERGAEWEKEYSVGYARPLGKNKYQTRGGFEWIHRLESRQINAGPVLGFAPTDSTWIVAGLAFPVNRREGNRLELRVLAEYEWF